MSQRYVPGKIYYVTDTQLRRALSADPERTRAVFRQARLTRRTKDIAKVTQLTWAEVNDIIRPRFEGRNAAIMERRFARRGEDKRSLDDALAAAREAGWSLAQIAEGLGVTKQYLHRLNPSGDVPSRKVRFAFDPPLRFTDPARVPNYALRNPDAADRRTRSFSPIPDSDTAELTTLLDRVLALNERRVSPDYTVSPEREELEKQVVAEAARLADKHGVQFSTLSRACGRSAYVLPRIMAHHGFPDALPASLAPVPA